MKIYELPLGTLFRVTGQHVEHLPKEAVVICYIGKFGITVTNGRRKFPISRQLYHCIKPKLVTLPSTPCYTELDVINLYPEYFI